MRYTRGGNEVSCVRDAGSLARACGLDVEKMEAAVLHGGAEFLVAYGSFARGDEWEGSDLDLACGCQPNFAEAIGGELARACAVPVDLRPFRPGTLAWRAEVALTGVCIWERQPGLWEATRAAVLQEWSRKGTRCRKRKTVPHEVVKARFG